MKSVSFLSSFTKWQFFCYLLILTLCFFLYNQGDLNHTALSSYAYLNGHFLDFYSYNLKMVGGNDYLPSIYIVFAIFNIPLTFFGFHCIDQSIASVAHPLLQISWWKLVNLTFFFSSVFTVSKISNSLLPKNQLSVVSPGLIFASAPIAIFCAFIFSQYDIVGLFFSLIGFYFYLKKDLIRFSLYFSIAISFKFFGLVIFIPLLLLAEKNILSLFKYAFIAILLTTFEIAIYYSDPTFGGEIFKLALGKVANGHSRLFYLQIICGLIYSLGCLWLFILEDLSDKISIFIPIAA